ncbi:MAG: anti-sigma factor [Candidatus Tectomicrobia bacterium]|nr:anti-sigma factor [Candidatus Tectomicrobia bacterium]
MGPEGYEDLDRDFQDVRNALQQFHGTATPSPTLRRRVLKRGEVLLGPSPRSMATPSPTVVGGWRMWLTPWSLLTAAVAACLIVLLFQSITLRLRQQNALLQQQVQMIQTQLHEVQGREQRLLQHQQKITQRLIGGGEQLGTHHFRSGHFGKAAEMYKDTADFAVSSPLRYRVLEATAAWYGCRYDDAIRTVREDIKPEQVKSQDEAAQAFFTLAAAYHSLDKTAEARQNYHKVIEVGAGPWPERAFFNLAVTHAAAYKRSHDRNEIASVKTYLQKSLASSTNASQRLARIHDALRPVPERDGEGNQCPDTFHKTGDLTPLATEADFHEWLAQRQREFLPEQ